jgi:hypothetical protein
MLGEVQEAIAIRVKVTECRCHMLTVGGDHALTLDLITLPSLLQT